MRKFDVLDKTSGRWLRSDQYEKVSGEGCDMIRSMVMCAGVMMFFASCAATSVTPIARNQVMISTSAAPACGVAGAQRVAAQMAAVETLRRGFERFTIVGAQAQNNVQSVMMPPTGAMTTGTFNTFGNTTFGSATTSYTGGGVMMTGSNDANLMVVMFNRGEDGFNNAVDARQTLGENWQELVENGVNRC